MGKKLSEETLAKMRASQQARWAKVRAEAPAMAPVVTKKARQSTAPLAAWTVKNAKPVRAANVSADQAIQAPEGFLIDSVCLRKDGTVSRITFAR